MLAYEPMKKLMNYFKSENRDFIDFLFVWWCLTPLETWLNTDCAWIYSFDTRCQSQEEKV